MKITRVYLFPFSIYQPQKIYHNGVGRGQVGLGGASRKIFLSYFFEKNNYKVNGYVFAANSCIFKVLDFLP